MNQSFVNYSDDVLWNSLFHSKMLLASVNCQVMCKFSISMLCFAGIDFAVENELG